VAKSSFRLSLLCLLCLACTVATAQDVVTVPLTAFNAGELSPKMEGRVDYSKYAQGLRQCENLLPLTQGPVIRRPGTMYVAATKNNGAVRLIPFEYSVDDTYMLEFGDLYMRVYRNQAQVLDGNDPYEIVTPYDANEIGDLQFVQTSNSMYLVDGNDSPYVLTRAGHTNWTIEDVNFITGPFLPRESNAQTITILHPEPNEVDEGYGNVQPSYNTEFDIYEKRIAAQTFTISGGGNVSVSGASVKMYRGFLGSPGLIYVEIWPTDANEPNGVAVATKAFDGSKLSSLKSDWRSVTFDDPVTLLASTMYALVVRAPYALKQAYWKYDSTGDVNDGQAWYSTNDGTTWTALSSGKADFAFNIESTAAGVPPGDIVTLTTDEALFDAGHVGSVWKLYHQRVNGAMSGTIDAAETTGGFPVSGSYNATSRGTWKGVLSLQRSDDDGATWTPVATVASDEDDNLNHSGSETASGILYRLEMIEYTSGKATFVISLTDYLDYGIVKITDVNDPCTATATILDDLVSTDPTNLWQEGSWSDYRGWPKAIAFHEQRLWFAGSTGYPQTVWATQTAESEGDYEDMTVVALDDDSALIYTLPGKNPIQWLYSYSSYLMVGSAGGVGRLGSLEEAMTPTNIEYRLQTKSGASPIQPIGIGDVLLYVERGGRKVRQYLYQYDVDQFIAPDVSILAEHITSGGLLGIALQRSPQPIVWCPRADGEAVTMTYLREEEVTAWARQVTDGQIESIATLPGSEEDEVWWAVARTIDSNTVRYIEVLQPHDWGTDQNDCWFVDSGLYYDGEPATTFENLDHLEGETVAIWADGVALEPMTVDSNTITLDDSYQHVVIGLPYASTLETMPLVISTSSGPMLRNQKRVTTIGIDFYESIGASAGASEATLQDVVRNSSSTDLYSQWQEISDVDVGWLRKPTIWIRQEDPAPMCVRQIEAVVRVGR
jgi:hypothetical protein